MNTRTRRRLIFCSLVVALTLPVESVLLQALSTSDPQQAAAAWAGGLSPDSLSQAAQDISSYSTGMRKAIMTALPPEGRSQVWRDHIAAYIKGHPDLSDAAVTLLQQMMALASPDNLSAPTAAVRAQVRTTGDQIQAAIGRQDALELLFRLGPADGTFVNSDPISLKAANWVRGKFVALAAMMASGCDCNMDWGCDGIFNVCRDNTGCEVKDTWPACGWLWDDPCNGACRSYFSAGQP